MDINSEVAGLLKQYQDLPESTRRELWCEILAQLHPYEWNCIKSRCGIDTFQYDILGRLPLEIAFMVMENLSLTEIIRFRRVSRRWNHLLSSPQVCMAAVRATLGKDPWAPMPPSALAITIRSSLPHSRPDSLEADDSILTSNESSNAWTLAIRPSHNPRVNAYSATSFMKFAKRRYRLEQGIPYKVNRTLSPVAEDCQNNAVDARAVVTYSDGYCAWLDARDNRTSVFVLNLVNGRGEKYTTEEKEQLYTLRFSRPFIAASSTRGYCHVVVRYPNHVIHWSFETRVPRTLQIGNFVAAIAVHPSEDQVTAVRFRRKDGDEYDALEGQIPLDFSVLVQDYRLHVATYALSSGDEWSVLSSHYVPLPTSIFPRKWIHLGFPADSFGIYHPGQSSVTLVQYDEMTEVKDEPITSTFCLDVEPDGRVAFHTCPRDIFDRVELFRPEQGILYAGFLQPYPPVCAILKCRAVLGPANSYLWYDYEIHRTCEELGNSWIIGDARFMVIFDEENMDVWVMEDDEEVVDWNDLRLS
ncbi:hypothetical protein F1880_000035 [Penicillium rolfsii]|nr:hypothetical protein F1880_000035 [Penicillium rolfsii]